MFNSLGPHGLQHAGLPCPSLSPWVCSNSCSLSQWCHPTISSSVVLFSSHLQSFPASGSCPMSQLFASGGQSIGASASASVLPMIIQDWFPLGLTSLISLQTKGLSRLFSNTTVQKHQFFSTQPSSWSSSHIHVTTGKTTALTIRTFVSKVMCLLFNTVYWNQLTSTKIMNSATFSSFTFVSFTKNALSLPKSFLLFMAQFSLQDHVNSLGSLYPRLLLWHYHLYYSGGILVTALMSWFHN